MNIAQSGDELRESWRSVRTIEAMIQANTGPVLGSLIPHATGFARVPESLLLIFSVSVLEAALKHFRNKGDFTSPGIELRALMKASKTALAWQDYGAVDRVRLRRNRVAHRAELLNPGECADALAVIARELLAWNVLTEDTKIRYAVSFRPDTQSPLS